MARALDADGRPDEALALYRITPGGDPRDPAVADRMGWIYLQAARLPEAVRIYQDLVAGQPNSSTCRYHYGMALLGNGDRDQAMEQFQRALELNPPPEERDRIRASRALRGRPDHTSASTAAACPFAFTL